jgi:predicted dehydrogenase
MKSVLSALAAVLMLSLTSLPAAEAAAQPAIRVGIIGLDTSHVIAFTESLNRGPKNPADAPRLAGVRVVAAYPQGSRDIESSTRRVPEYTAAVQAMGVEIVGSIPALLERVDAVLLESNDGRVHLEQVLPVLRARKPVFVDKPLAGSFVDVLRILDAADAAGVPLFCSSSLRFAAETVAVARGAIGRVLQAETFGPFHIEPTHPDLYWYGVHGCESLFTVMGTGCRSVRRVDGPNGMVEVVGEWDGNRTGIFRPENGKDRRGYGGVAVGERGERRIGAYDGYDPLLIAIVEMFRTGKSPVSRQEMVELYAFMEGADESKRRGGAAVPLHEIIAKARDEIAASVR